MTAPVTAATRWHLPAEVVEFARSHQVESCLKPMMEATQRIFPTAHALRVHLTQDPELRDDRHIVFDVQVSARDVTDFVAANHEWTRELYRCCPAPLVCTFWLSLDLVD